MQQYPGQQLQNPVIAEQLFDLSMLEEMDDMEYLLETVDLFIKDTAFDLKQLREGLHKADTDVVYKKAHKAKSSAGVIQAAALITTLHNIEGIAKAGNINDELYILVTNASAQFALVEKSLKKQLGI